MALKKADALAGRQGLLLGRDGRPGHKDKPYYIPPERIEQAKRMVQKAGNLKVSNSCCRSISSSATSGSSRRCAGDQQFDIGPKTTALFERKVGEFIEANRGQRAAVFHNGVFGMFEDARYEAGTKAFIAQLKRMKDAGLAVYVGGGEGGTALEKYGQPDWVTHCFTAGGTVLNALGAEPVPYLVALRKAAK